jgi:hypothetical protein
MLDGLALAAACLLLLQWRLVYNWLQCCSEVCCCIWQL